MQLLLQPVDTFFFRDHKPFSSGEDTYASGIFPPRPGTIYGGLRSAYIHSKSDFDSFNKGENQEVRKWMGTPNDIGAFFLKGIFIYYGEEIYLPLPLDYQTINDEIKKSEEVLPLKLIKGEKFFSSQGDAFFLEGPSDKKSASSSGAFVGIKEWKKELLARKGVSIKRAKDFISSEYKLGISRDWKSKKTEDGMLYQIELNRFKDGAGLLVQCENAPDFSQVSYARMGGKNRPWRIIDVKRDYEILSHEDKITIIKQIKESGIARIIFLTPTIWDKGSLSSKWIVDNKWLKLDEQLKVKILTKVLGRPILIGGWDIAKERPKKRLNAIPAGSVIYVEVPPEFAEILVEKVCNTKITDYLEHEGYGLAICGCYS